MDLSEIKNLVEAQGKQVEAAMTKYQGQVDTLGAAHKEVKDEVKATSEAFAKLQADFTTLAQKGFKLQPADKPVTAGQEFVNSSQFKAFVEGKGEVSRVRYEVQDNITSVKSTTINSGATTFPMQMPGVIAGGFVPVTVRQMLRTIPVSTNAVNSLRENVWTNSAAEASEGSAKKESDITFDNYDVPIRTIAHWLKVSNQLLADAPAIVAYIETRLRDGLAQRVEAQIINGNGTSPNISGLTDSGNFTAFTPESDENLVDSINRAKYTLWSAGFPPDMVIVNPADWGAMERTREAANSGTYLYGMPGMAAGMNPFGLRVVLSTYVTAGKFIIGAFNPTVVLYERMGTVIEMGYVNADFTNNLVTIRAEERLGLGIERPAAIYYGDITTT